MNTTTRATYPDPAIQVRQLLSAAWSFTDGHHLIATQDRRINIFRNHPVTSIDDAVKKALSFSKDGQDVYFGVAAYKTPQGRTSENADGARALWLDIDCGKNKADSGRGYETELLARKAIAAFCKAANLPEPTFIIGSGSGLHVYWVFDAMLPRVLWLQYASKLKILCKRLGLLADPCRTADIASVMRLPGTLNYKYSPPRPVTLLSTSSNYIGV